MELEKVSSGLLSLGIMFASCGILREIRYSNDKINSPCVITNLTLASTLMLAGSAVNMYKILNGCGFSST